MQDLIKIWLEENSKKIKGFIDAKVPFSNLIPTFVQELGDDVDWNIIKKLYEAKLVSHFKKGHPFIKEIMNKDPELLRGTDGRWLSPTTMKPQTKSLELAFRTLPCCQNAELTGRKWKIKTNNIKLRSHISPDHKLPNWPEHRIQSGAPLFYFNNKPEDGIVRVHIPGTKPTKYRQFFKRIMTYDEAWNHLFKSFPGVNRTLIETIIVLRGIAESCQIMAPLLFIDGPSGSGKTTTIKIAAEIFGGKIATTQPHSGGNPEEVQRAIGEHLEKGADIIVLDEWGKGLPKKKLETVSNALLLSDINLTFRALFRGQITVPFNAPVILTNTDIPQYFIDDCQTARRVLGFSLDRKVPDWRITAGSIDGWRLRTEENNAACEVIYSNIIDQKFTSGLTPSEILKTLNRTTNFLSEQHDGDSQIIQKVKELFHLVCTTQTPGRCWRSDLEKKGFKTINKRIQQEDTESTKLSIAFHNIWDPPDYNVPRAISSLDLMEVLNLKCPAKFEIREHGRRVAFRFTSKINSRCKDFKINSELQNFELPNMPEQSEHNFSTNPTFYPN